MSFLTPLYILGALTVVAPILFHLIRRMPKGEVPFGSLMFLAPTPPRLNRRSRLDNLPLLLLRASALILLALAFARPFLRRPTQLDPGGVGRRRVAVVIDTSASLRRGDLWPKAQALAAEAIAGCQPGDQLAVFAFDATTRPLLGFEESKTLDPARRQAVAGALVRRLSPSWGATDLGQALVDAVAAVEDVTDPTEKSGRIPRRVILISDLQQGSRVDALGDFEWPSDVDLELKTVSDPRPNAGPQWLAAAAEAPAGGPTLRVRVANDPGARRESFALAWVDDQGRATGKPVDVYVPPGESRVVSVSRANGASTLRLTGDDHGFDNTLFLAPERNDMATVVYLGNDAADDPAGLLYYLHRVFEDSTRRGVTVVPRSPAAGLTLEKERSTPLVVLTSETTLSNAARLRKYALGGGTVLAVLATPGRVGTLAAVADVAPWDAAEAAVGRDTLLGRIAFEHPMFAPLAGAQFNDFTKIHFWKYRRLPENALGDDARVLARFENGDAAVVEKAVGKGRVVALASGWGPADSQLARSSKFVPLMSALLDGPHSQPPGAGSHKVGDRVPLPAADGADRDRVVRKPDGTTVAVPAGVGSFDGTDQPGVYTVDTADGPRAFAVNLDPAEGKTAPLHVETLEQFGCRLASRAPKAPDPPNRKQLQNLELEGRQKLWQWLTLSAIGVLIVETWLAGRLSRTRPTPAEALAT